MADVKGEIEEVGRTFDDLTQSIQSAATQSGKLRTAFLQLSSAKTSSGQAWTVLSRLSSGTGFWRIQNRIRAISNFLSFQDKKQEAIAKNENEAIDRLGKQLELQKKINVAETTLDKVKDNTASSEERKMFYQSEQYRYLELMYGKQEAMEEMTGRLSYAQEQLAKTDKTMLEQRVKSHKMMLEKGLSYRQIFLGAKMGGQPDDSGYNDFMRLSKAQQMSYIKHKDSLTSIKSLTSDIVMNTKDRISLLNSIAAKNDEIASKEALKQNTDILKDELKVLKDKHKALEEMQILNLGNQVQAELVEQTERQKLKDDKISFDDEGNLNLEGESSKGANDGFKDKSFMSIIGGQISNLIDKLPGGDMMKSMAKGVGKLFSSDNDVKEKARAALQANFKSFLRLAMRALRGLFIYLPIFVLIFMYLKESGWLDVIIGFFEGIFAWLTQIYVSFVEFAITIGDWFGSILVMFDAIFNGTSGEAWAAVEAVLRSTGVMLEAGLKLLIKDILIDFFFVALEGLGMALWEKYVGPESNFWSTVVNIAVDIMVMLLAWKVAHIAYMAFGKAGGAIAGLSVLFAGDALKKVSEEKIRGTFAKGGFVGQTGNYLVGEEGPEVVTLQQGSNVTANNKLGGNTTINISVNGRMGATDTELNDLANKLSSIISQKMQRQGTSGVFR